MDGNIKNYFNGIASSLPAEIISEEEYNKLYKMADLFSGFAASEYIMETHLHRDAAEADFSFRVLAEEKACLIDGLRNHHFSSLATDEVWAKVINFVDSWSRDIRDIWFEMDCSEYEKQIPRPCFFFDATQIIKGTDVNDRLLFNSLKQLLDIEQLNILLPNLQKVIQQLPPEAGLFQAGVMLARNSKLIRIFTAELTREQTEKYLSNIGWIGSFLRLEELFQLIHQYSDGRYILDFDVAQEGISKKIGINFGLKTKKILPDFLKNLVEHRLCTDEKRRGVLAWPGSKGSFLGSDYGYAALIKDISHFKISCSPEEDIKTKAYLRVMGVYMKELFKAQAPTQLVPVQQGGQNG